MDGTNNLEETNRQFFDDLANKYGMEGWQSDIIARVTRELQDQKDFIGADWVDSSNNSIGRKLRLLDYACGTGLATKALAPFITHATGIDLSEKMIEQYTDTVTTVPITALVGNICHPDPPTDPRLTAQDTYNFDLAIISLGFHHFEHQQLAIDRLAERLRPGGILLVIDLADTDQPPDMEHAALGRVKHVMARWGYSREDMKEFMDRAGLEAFDFHMMDGDIEMKIGGGGHDHDHDHGQANGHEHGHSHHGDVHNGEKAEEVNFVRHAFFARAVKPQK